MLQEYNEIFHELNKYLISFRKKGFDDPASQKIRKLISDIGDTPLKRVFSTFGLDEFSRCLTVTAMLCDVSFTAANAVKGLCTVKNGITPGLISALFYGTYDISQHIDALGRYSPLFNLCLDLLSVLWSISHVSTAECIINGCIPHGLSVFLIWNN